MAEVAGKKIDRTGLLRRARIALRRWDGLLSLLYCVDVTLICLYYALGTTRWSLGEWMGWGRADTLRILLCRGMFVLFVISMVRSQRRRDFWIRFVIFVLMLLYRRVGNGSQEITWLIISALAAYRVPIRKIMGSLCLAIGAMLVIVGVCSQTGALQDLVYYGTNHSMGIVYYTDASAHIAFWMLMYCAARKGRLDPLEYLTGVLILLLQVTFLRGRTDAAVIALLLAGTFFWQYLQPQISARLPELAGGARRFFGWLLILLYPLLTLVMWLGSITYSEDARTPINTVGALSTVRSRLILGKLAYKQMPLRLFGNNVHQVGYGGKTTLAGSRQYFFIDSSFIRLVVQYGLILCAVVLFLMVFAMVRCYQSRQYYFMFLLGLVALMCIFEHHILEASYNTFLLFPFAALGSRRRRSPVRVPRPRPVRGEALTEMH